MGQICVRLIHCGVSSQWCRDGGMQCMIHHSMHCMHVLQIEISFHTLVQSLLLQYLLSVPQSLLMSAIVCDMFTQQLSRPLAPPSPLTISATHIPGCLQLGMQMRYNLPGMLLWYTCMVHIISGASDCIDLFQS